MTSRRNKRDATTGNQVVAPQLTEYVFNVRGHAMQSVKCVDWYRRRKFHSVVFASLVVKP
jgi:hypothetical protein